MAESTPPRSRWFQFSLRSLFWLTLVVATSLFGFRERQERLRYQAETKAVEEERQNNYADFERQYELQLKLLNREVARAKAIQPEFELRGVPVIEAPAEIGPKHW